MFPVREWSLIHLKAQNLKFYAILATKISSYAKTVVNINFTNFQFSCTIQNNQIQKSISIDYYLEIFYLKLSTVITYINQIPLKEFSSSLLYDATHAIIFFFIKVSHYPLILQQATSCVIHPSATFLAKLIYSKSPLKFLIWKLHLTFNINSILFTR